jgi:TonB family protein
MNHSVDPELIRRYLAGQLDDKAMHALERQALDDPFLAEALEGYAERKPDQRAHLADLDKRLQRRVQDKGEKNGGIFRLNSRWMAAAGILLVAGTGLLWIWQRNTGKEYAIAARSTSIADSAITDTLQYYNQEVPMAWGKATPEKPLAVSVPADTGLLAARNRKSAGEYGITSMMMKNEADSLAIAAVPSPIIVKADSLNTAEATAIASAQPKEANAEEANDKATAYNPAVTTRLIQGRVKDVNDENGLPGVSVSVEGLKQGALTDDQGRFSVRVADTVKDVRLVAAAAGYNSRKMRLRQQENNVDIGLHQQSAALGDVAVSGYAKKKAVYQRPAPVGGYERYQEYLSKHVNYPASAAAGNIQGKVKVSFRVMPDGTLEDVKVVRRLQPDCDAEALRLVKEGPEWTPASDRKATRVQVEVSFAPK